MDVTATFSPYAATWQRTTPQPGNTLDVALASDGVIVAGTTRVTATNNALWWTHIRTNGEIAATVIDDVTTAYDMAYRVAVAPDGDVVVTAFTGSSASIPATPAIRRYSPTGALRWSTSPGAGGAFGVAVDADGNVYAVGGQASAPFVVSYTAAGVERWRRTPAAWRLSAVAVRGNVVAAAGEYDGNGNALVTTFDREGAPGWSRVVPRGTYAGLSFTDIGIDSEGDVVVGGDGSPSGVTTAAFLVRAIAADGAAELWQQRITHRIGGTSKMSLAPDDTIAVWAGHVQSIPEHSTLRRIAEDGTVGPTMSVPWIEKAGGLAVDAAGGVIMASWYQMSAWPMIQRRP